jgi:hypothetical protein
VPDAGASEALQAWAWDQTIPAEWKLTLLALCTGEVEPELEKALKRTGLGSRPFNIACEGLHRRGLIDDDHRPVGPFG